MSIQHLTWWRRVLTAKLALLTVAAHGAPFSSGDVLIGTHGDTSAAGHGIVIQYRGGQNIGTLDTGLPGHRVVAMCTNGGRSFLFAVASANTSSAVVRFDSQGVIARLTPNSNIWANIPNNPASACVVNHHGDVYVATRPNLVGQFAALQKYSASGVLLASFTPADIGNATSIDLSFDQCTLTYTAAGKLKRFDVCSGEAGAQLADVDQTNLGQSCSFARYTYRGQTMAVCDGKAFLLTSSSQVQTTYDPQECVHDSRARFIFLSFDPDKQTVWATTYADPLRNQKACRLNIATTHWVADFSIEDSYPYSIQVYGEQTAASRNCRRVFGKVLCLVASKFPYLSIHDQPVPRVQVHP